MVDVGSGIGNEHISPDGKIGLATLPALESKPFLLRMIFILILALSTQVDGPPPTIYNNGSNKPIKEKKLSVHANGNRRKIEKYSTHPDFVRHPCIWHSRSAIGSAASPTTRTTVTTYPPHPS